jgi:hypothetical protein
MLIKIKNIRAGIVIIADAGLKLAPGEVAEMETLTPQTRSAVADGMLAQLESETESKPRGKPAAKVDESKMSATGQAASTVDVKPAENAAAAASQSSEKTSTLFEGAKNGPK